MCSLQYKCISSYAFASLGALEGAIALSTGTLRELSAQSIVDCSCELAFSELFNPYACLTALHQGRVMLHYIFPVLPISYASIIQRFSQNQSSTHIILDGYALTLIMLSWAVQYGNRGCSGGTVENAYAYIINNKGVDPASYYPFKGYVSEIKQRE